LVPRFDRAGGGERRKGTGSVPALAAKVASFDERAKVAWLSGAHGPQNSVRLVEATQCAQLSGQLHFDAEMVRFDRSGGFEMRKRTWMVLSPALYLRALNPCSDMVGLCSEHVAQQGLGFIEATETEKFACYLYLGRGAAWIVRGRGLECGECCDTVTTPARVERHPDEVTYRLGSSGIHNVHSDIEIRTLKS
jgi:hypothetical protein